MRNIVLVAAVGCLLAGCSSEVDADADGDGTVSQAEMAAMADSAIRPDPGQYRSTTELIEADIPGAPANMVEMMKSGMANQTTEYCLTQEEADKGFEEMAKGSQDGECTTSKFVVNGGDIDAEMSCKAGSGEMRMTMDGTGTTTSMDMTMTMEGEIPGMGDAKMVMRVQSERIGDCT